MRVKKDSQDWKDGLGSGRSQMAREEGEKPAGESAKWGETPTASY